MDIQAIQSGPAKWQYLPLLLAVLATLSSGSVNADMISFDTNDWDHGAGPQPGWNDHELTGTTTFSGISLTITSNMVGSAVPTGSHMARINQSYFTGFAFQLDPSTTVNSGGSLQNYARIDFEFSEEVYLTSFTLTDVDRANGSWYDVIAAEGFVNGLGAVGTGLNAEYTFNDPTNEEVVDRFGLRSARPRSNTGNLQNTPPVDVTFHFNEGVRAFSIYYWNDTATDTGSSTQTIGIRGNQFEIERVPEPGSIAMCLIAAFMMLLIQRYRKNHEATAVSAA